MMTLGKTKPAKKMNFFGEVPFFLRIVQEKVSWSKPREPQTPNIGIIWNK
jgi:hypothetical protein